MRKTLPSFTMLTAFEAAARLSSFSKAARELNVTQPAVSKQIRGLEEHIGRKLFRRSHRTIELTEAGGILAKAMSRSFIAISDAIRQLADTPEREELVISSLAAFANLWLAPRLTTFQSLHPNVSVRLIAYDDPANARLAESSIDVAIRFGDGNWRDGIATLLYHDKIFPVCSPRFARSVDPMESLADIVEQPLVGYDKLEADWFSWNDWLQACGFDGPPVRTYAQYSNYSDAILATINGQGIALGWQALVQGYIDRGELVRVSNFEVTVRSGRYAVVSATKMEDPRVRAFVAWLQIETASWEEHVQNAT
ncbi:LysR substrate-binding domain-containing protein [Mesorhizobium sp. VK22B]|uniref:LysR substrate-binding domain-containing protein n=1 Tax=Mesorhizobium captivum TaxID=3072319 RepID=A0ABU4ZAJ2_9HYPH|nr:LysR substrate-binding domain-containing protein [Mesorhizobium sp. VK22B]MDX8496257.1 LysR substrate-binding domain-containing protein [Mesorhizobium sp. VK22B]